MLNRQQEMLKQLGVLTLDESGRVSSFDEKPEFPKSDIASTGIYAFPKEYIKEIGDYMKTDKSKEGVGFLIKDFGESGEVYGCLLEGRWSDIGTKETYKEYKKKKKTHKNNTKNNQNSNSVPNWPVLDNCDTYL